MLNEGHQSLSPLVVSREGGTSHAWHQAFISPVFHPFVLKLTYIRPQIIHPPQGSAFIIILLEEGLEVWRFRFSGLFCSRQYDFLEYLIELWAIYYTVYTQCAMSAMKLSWLTSPDGGIKHRTCVPDSAFYWLMNQVLFPGPSMTDTYFSVCRNHAHKMFYGCKIASSSITALPPSSAAARTLKRSTVFIPRMAWNTSSYLTSATSH